MTEKTRPEEILIWTDATRQTSLIRPYGETGLQCLD